MYFEISCQILSPCESLEDNEIQLQISQLASVWRVMNMEYSRASFAVYPPDFEECPPALHRHEESIDAVIVMLPDWELSTTACGFPTVKDLDRLLLHIFFKVFEVAEVLLYKMTNRTA